LAGSPVAWNRLADTAASLKLTPFHWEIEFPEIFTRSNGGFDAIIGNPPFLGGTRISTEIGERYRDWLLALHEGAHGNSDLVAHFFRRAFQLLRRGGVFGLIATNTIGQGDTRATGLAVILRHRGEIIRAAKRLPWPGEAAVIVSVVHVGKDVTSLPILDNRPVSRISAYLIEGAFDEEPNRLTANARKSFAGSKIYGAGFTFDDAGAKKGISGRRAKWNSSL
jgi:Eco57I restriction-modification methylase